MLLLLVSYAIIIDILIELIIRLIGLWLGMGVFLRVEIVFLTAKKEDLIFMMLWILMIDVKKGVYSCF